jgi:hypothetical protein
MNKPYVARDLNKRTAAVAAGTPIAQGSRWMRMPNGRLKLARDLNKKVVA